MSKESLEEEEWMRQFRERAVKREDSSIEDFTDMLEETYESKVKMTAEEFRMLPRGVKLAIIDLHMKLEHMEYQIDEIRSICS